MRPEVSAVASSRGRTWALLAMPTPASNSTSAGIPRRSTPGTNPAVLRSSGCNSFGADLEKKLGPCTPKYPMTSCSSSSWVICACTRSARASGDNATFSQGVAVADCATGAELTTAGSANAGGIVRPDVIARQVITIRRPGMKTVILVYFPARGRMKSHSRPGSLARTACLKQTGRTFCVVVHGSSGRSNALATSS